MKLLRNLALTLLFLGIAPAAEAGYTGTTMCVLQEAEPRTLGVYDSTGVCVPIGTLNSASHTFEVSGASIPNGSITISGHVIPLGGSQTLTCDDVGGSSSCSVDATNASNINSGFLPNARLANSSMTIAGHVVSLGGTQALTCADIGGAASCSTDATNATNITSGTLAAARGGTGLSAFTRSGTTTGFTTFTGTFTPGNGVVIDANGNLQDAGGPPTIGGGGGTVNAGTAGQLTFYGASTNTVSGNANATISGGAVTLGSAGVGGSLNLTGSTSGLVSINPQAAAGTYNFNLPTTAGAAGSVLTSGGGVNNAMTWTTLAASATTDTTNAANITSGTLPNARLSAVPNSALANSSMTIAGHAVSLGGTQALTCSDIGAAASCSTNTTDAANISSGNLAAARIATALTTPGPIGGTTPAAGTFTTLTSNSIVSTQLPGLSSSVQSTGIPGLDGGKWMIWENGAWEDGPALRVDRHMNSGTGLTAHTYKGIWANCSTNASNVGYEWCGTFQLSNTALATTASQNVALNATAFKEDNGKTAALAHTWASNFNCTDRSGENNPTNACIGSEIDMYVDNPYGTATTDTNQQRVIAQLSGRSSVTNTHVGRGLFINSDSKTTIDNAIEIQDKTANDVFVVDGAGNTTISSNTGSWGGVNTGKTLVLSPKTNAGANPALGILDTNKTNAWALWNASGQLRLSSMPDLSDSSTAPTNAFTVAHSDATVTFGAMYKPGVYTIATLPTCNSTNRGAVVRVSNGRTYASSGYGTSATTAGTSTVTRLVLCTNNGTDDWYYN